MGSWGGFGSEKGDGRWRFRPVIVWVSASYAVTVVGAQCDPRWDWSNLVVVSLVEFPMFFCCSGFCLCFSGCGMLFILG